MSLFGKKTEKKKEETTAPAEVLHDEKKVQEAVVEDFPVQDMGRVLIAPFVTEKSHALVSVGKYVFRVARDAQKRTVKHAVEKAYSVHVENVHIIKIPAKRRTVKQDRGYQSVGKKAVVTLRTGEKIALFETV